MQQLGMSVPPSSTQLEVGSSQATSCLPAGAHSYSYRPGCHFTLDSFLYPALLLLLCPFSAPIKTHLFLEALLENACSRFESFPRKG